MSIPEQRYVETQQGLQQALEILADADVVGVDVERADAHRYWRTPALIQVGSARTIALIDPLALHDLAPLDAFLRSRTVILHAMENDIVPLEHVSVQLHRIEDTAAAASILGLPTGLETLLEQLLGITFNGEKSRMQRADWARRPLPRRMLAYAAADVVGLPELWQQLETRLIDGGRYSWYREELEAMRAQPPIEERRSWTRLRGIGRLDQRGQTRARVLWQERERLARSTDTAPARILSDRVLLELARTPVDDARGLRSLGVRRQSARRFGSDLLQALRQATDGELTSHNDHRLSDAERSQLDRLRSARSRRAQELGIDPGLLCPNRTLLQAVTARPTSLPLLRQVLDLRAWQWEQLAPALADALNLDQAGTPGSVPAGSTQEPAMTHVLNPDALHHELDRLNGWGGTTKEGISKTFVFDDFAGSIAFVNRLAEHAEAAGHHPDLAISWNKVTVTYVTHSASGVTQADVEQARAADDVYAATV